MKSIFNGHIGLYERDGKAFCDSIQVAKEFEKRHDNVLRDIKGLDCEMEFRLLNFEESTYLNRGKPYPMYLMTRDGFMFLVMGYTGRKAAQIKQAYIERFNQMEEFIQILAKTKEDFSPFSGALVNLHGRPTSCHLINEINMIYKLVLGCDAKSFRERNSLPKGVNIRPYLTPDQLRAVRFLQEVDKILLETISDYKKRKEMLTEQYQAHLIK